MFGAFEAHISKYFVHQMHQLVIKQIMILESLPFHVGARPCTWKRLHQHIATLLPGRLYLPGPEAVGLADSVVALWGPTTCPKIQITTITTIITIVQIISKKANNKETRTWRGWQVLLLLLLLLFAPCPQWPESRQQQLADRPLCLVLAWG